MYASNVIESCTRTVAAGEPPIPSPVGSHEERLDIARSIGYSGAACLTCGQIERGLTAQLDWEM
jgi:hypothetical protein